MKGTENIRYRDLVHRLPLVSSSNIRDSCVVLWLSEDLAVIVPLVGNENYKNLVYGERTGKAGEVSG